MRKFIVAGTLISLMLGALPNEAHAFRWVFPYNHPDLKWYTIETEHFSVHYPVSRREREQGNDHYLTAEWAARKYAKVAEESWQPMCEQFNYFLKEKVHIVVLNQGDELEGFTIPSWDWIVMSSNPGGSFYRSRGRMEWFSDVFVHEFAHVVSLKANAAHSEGTYASLNGGLYENGINTGRLNHSSTGVEVPIGDGDSVFWTEGGAEYWSDNANYNWWTTSRDQNIRMTVLEDRLLEYSEWHTRAGKTGWNDSERYYQQGYSFGLYLRERFGDETYAKFAHEYSKRWRPQWETVVEDVLGIDAETLYWDWRNYVTERYAEQYEQVKARGEVMGKEMLGGPPDWEYHDPEGRDEYLSQDMPGTFGKKNKRQLEVDKERTGTYQWEPRASPDGRYWGVISRGTVTIHQEEDDQVWAFTGVPASDPLRGEESQNLSFGIPYSIWDHGWDFVPGQEAVVLTGSEEMHPRSMLGSAFHFEGDGYDWKQLYLYEFPDVVEQRQGNRVVETRNPQRKLLRGWFHERQQWKGKWKPIPNTKRGSDASVSPDGKRVAYLEYTDGTLNLVTINLDGTDKKHLTTFDDGTWLQTPDWSPDGSQIVFAIFRNYQQNLYVINADGTGLKPIMVDEWEDLDAHWSAYDGRIYFSSDPGGVFNIYSYDPKSGDFLQLTNVIAAATTPQVTKEGNLIYSYVTAHGWKVYGLPRDQFLNAPANHLFETEFEPEQVDNAMAFREDMSEFDALVEPYKPRNAISAPIFLPIYRLENDTRTNWGMQGGFQAQLMDYVQYNQAFLYFLLGEDTRLQGGYTYDGWYPSLTVYGGRYFGKNNSGYLLDADDDPVTTSDQETFEIRRDYAYNFGGGLLEYQWNSNFLVGIGAFGLDYQLKGVDASSYERYMWWVNGTAQLTWSNNSFLGSSINPYFGRTVDLIYTHGYTDIVYEPYGGVVVDDGHLLSEYQFNQYEVRWTEQIPVPTFGLPFLEYARGRRHTIQLDANVGLIDRNVSGNNEFSAGGRHPYNWGYGSIQSNTQFAGYPEYSLSGETMVILNGAYRFPLTDPSWHKMVGPAFLYAAAFQVGGTVGNLWSFRPPEDPAEYYRGGFDERIAYDPNDVAREIPFLDDAYKNGNGLLTDVSAELRLSSVLYHGMQWDSFLRVAYGFNEIRGYGDVNGDDITDTNDSATGDELSNETEPAGVRVYIGLGTGW